MSHQGKRKTTTLLFAVVNCSDDFAVVYCSDAVMSVFYSSVLTRTLIFLQLWSAVS